ncbi:general secretion pathway protein GspB [Marilutibacter alkalisoli]|uniref:Type II secretion system protein GspB C-terminal domain-containing protein n=1 Tax=Marilutibacter alkalisoli TaxID=2591633 RepID=A0A514BT57_9GAMM|nr:general secretion pathway protein GspB [Lysobacter alkalisoli]QDH70573.1 hypothetical protein FKV23_11160 [Lysobacter alkalisoli]
MSLILEALRKSEAERRRGEVPDLLSEPRPVARSRSARRPRAWTWVVAVLAAAVALPVVWLLREDPAGPLADVQAPGVPTVAITGSATAPASVDAAPQVLAPSTGADPAPDLPSPGPAPVSEAVAVPVPAAVPSPQRPEPRSTAIHQRPAEPTPGPISEPTPIGSSPGPAIEPVQIPAPVPEPGNDRLLPLSGLSGEERRQLPPLKVSMHMWSEDPARRFAIIDGNRVGEGDMAGNTVVTAITRDAVVLDWQGRRLELPIR